MNAPPGPPDRLQDAVRRLAGASMATELVAAGSGVPRRSAVGSLLALPVADAVAMLACFAVGGLLNFSYQNVTEERTLILVLLILGALVVFQHYGHYARRRQLWQEVGDIACVAAGALLFDLALLYLRRAVELWRRQRTGPDALALIRAEPAFPPALRQRPEFQRLLAEAP